MGESYLLVLVKGFMRLSGFAFSAPLPFSASFEAMTTELRLDAVCASTFRTGRGNLTLHARERPEIALEEAGREAWQGARARVAETVAILSFKICTGILFSFRYCRLRLACLLAMLLR